MNRMLIYKKKKKKSKTNHWGEMGLSLYIKLKAVSQNFLVPSVQHPLILKPDSDLGERPNAMTSNPKE